MLEDVLKSYGAEEVEAIEVYRDMFSLGDGAIQKSGERNTLKANPIGYWKNKGQKKGHYRVFLDDTFEETLKEMQEADFAIMNGLTYFGRKNLQEHASKMYAMIFDLDGVTEETLQAFLSGAFAKDYDIYPLPNYIILSGHGLHLYYVFEEPIPLYPNIKIQLKAFKYALTDKMWNMYTSKQDKKQFQGINQGFRPIGGKTKIDGVRVRAFRLNTHPCGLSDLGKYIPEESRVDESKLWKESKMTLAEAKKAYPQWYQDKVINKQERSYWKIKPDLYEWWKRQMMQASYGHRYFNIMCLAIYGAKCDISYEKVKADALEFIPFMNLIAPNHPFTKDDVMSALECYDRKYCTFPLDDIEKLSGIQIERNRRNGRTQESHLKRARALLEVANSEAGKALQGRKPKAEAVREWREAHPNGKKIECHRETGLSRPTIDRWWNE